MRTDPSETGGLFVGRRPGTAPVRYRTLPKLRSAARQRFDNSFANALLAAMMLLCLACWGPIPIACLLVGSLVSYASGNVDFGILVAFVALCVLLFGALMILRRIDNLWVLVRRAAGRDQRTGALGRVFGLASAVCAAAFMFWFLVIHGPGPTSMPGNP